MPVTETIAKLQGAAGLIIAYGDGRAAHIPGARTWPTYEQDRERDTLIIGEAVIEFQDERIWAQIDPDGTLTVKQNWSEPFSSESAVIEVEPSDATVNARRRIAARLDGRRPHPEVEWTVNLGPWITGRMEGKVILEAGMPRGPGSHVIILPGGRTATTFTEAERLLTGRYFPHYAPISLEVPKAKSR